MAFPDIDPPSLEKILDLQRDDFEHLAIMKRRRVGSIARDHDIAMGLWADELDIIGAGAPSRKKFRTIWSSGEASRGENATSQDPTPAESPQGPSQVEVTTPAPFEGLNNLPAEEQDTRPVESLAEEQVSGSPSPYPVDLFYSTFDDSDSDMSYSPSIGQHEPTIFTSSPQRGGDAVSPPTPASCEPEANQSSRDEVEAKSEEPDEKYISIPSDGPMSESAPPLGPTKNCIVCSEALPLLERVECPCSHLYCFSCMKNFARVSMEDESRFPPRCCGQVIPRATIKPALSTEVWEKYLGKIIEFGTPIRLYCHSCNVFIPSTKIENDLGQCSTCESKTCVYCREKEHQHECPKDKSTSNFLRFAQTQNWTRCPSCRTMVDKQFGCHHMECKCGTNFCYGCGEPWSRCHARCLGRSAIGPPVATNNQGDDQNDANMDEPRPRPFLTGPLNDLTAQKDNDGQATSATTPSNNAIVIKDEPTRDLPNLPTAEAPSSLAGQTPISNTQGMCSGDTPFNFQIVLGRCDRCHKIRGHTHYRCTGCLLQTCQTCWALRLGQPHESVKFRAGRTLQDQPI